MQLDRMPPPLNPAQFDSRSAPSLIPLGPARSGPSAVDPDGFGVLCWSSEENMCGVDGPVLIGAQRCSSFRSGWERPNSVHWTPGNPHLLRNASPKPHEDLFVTWAPEPY